MRHQQLSCQKTKWCARRQRHWQCSTSGLLPPGPLAPHLAVTGRFMPPSWASETHEQNSRQRLGQLERQAFGFDCMRCNWRSTARRRSDARMQQREAFSVQLHHSLLVHPRIVLKRLDFTIVGLVYSIKVVQSVPFCSVSFAHDGRTGRSDARRSFASRGRSDSHHWLAFRVRYAWFLPDGSCFLMTIR